MDKPIRFDDRVVIVTGSSRGIGRELAKMFAARGAKVIVSGRTRETAEKVVAEIEASGGTATSSIGDVADPDCAKAAVAQALDRYDRIDIVVNNAGVLGFSPFAEMSRALLDEIFDVNLRGAFNVTQAAWPHMQRAGYGRVLFFPSHAIFGAPNSAHYALSKGAIYGLMRSLYVEGKQYGINVNAVMPFAVTDMMVNAMSSGASIVEGDTSDLVAAAQYLQPELIAPIVAWLSHHDSTISGELFTAGGGRIARVFLAETIGYFNQRLTPESVRDHVDDICREKGYRIPSDVTASLGMVVEVLKKVD